MCKIIPRSKLGQFVFFFFETFITYFILVANTRAFTQANYLWTAITDTLFTAQSWIVGTACIEDKDARTRWAAMGSIIGGTCGSLFSIFLTKRVYGH